MSDDREDRLGKLCEELQQALDAGESIQLARLAGRFGLDVDEVARAVEALQCLHEALGEDQLAAIDLTPPELPDDYELRGELGRGGMGIVYRAHQRSLDRELAVKVLRPGDLMFADALQRFEREAKSLARLRHRHIVSVHEVGKADGFVYFTMDLVEGETLADRLRNASMTTAQTVRLLLQLTSAIAYAHGKGVVHRDLKPANILIDGDDNAFVVDFGLARDLAAGDAATMTGQMLGTPAYMSPEQALGDRDKIGEASDVYALGAILYECLTDRSPFAGLPLAQLMHAVIEREPESVTRHNARVPDDLRVICEKAMQKEPALRYATVQALTEDLERFSTGRSILARPPSPWSQSVRFVQRHRRTLVGTLVPVLVLLASVWWLAVPAILRNRTQELAERMYAAGNVQGAAAAYLEALAGTDPERLPLRDRVAYLRSLVDEVGRVYVHGDKGEVEAAARIVEEAKRVLGDCNRHDYWLAFADEDEQLVDQLRIESLRMEPHLQRRSRVYYFDVADARERVLQRRQQTGHEADLLFAFWKTAAYLLDGTPTERFREATVALLRNASNLPEHLQDRLRTVCRCRVTSDQYEYVDEAFLAELVAIASDRRRALDNRQDAASLFHLCEWLPFSTKTESPDHRGTRIVVEPADLIWLEQAWQELRDLDRLSRYRRRVDLVAERLAAAEARTGPQHDPGQHLWWWLRNHTGCPTRRDGFAAWWQDNRERDPRALLLEASGWNVAVADLTPDAILDHYERLHDARAHYLLSLCVADDVRIPSYGRFSAPAVRTRWLRALQNEPLATRLLRTATFAIVDGEPIPRLIHCHQHLLDEGTTHEWEFEFGHELPFLGVQIGKRVPQRMHGGHRFRIEGQAHLNLKNDGVELTAGTMVRGWPIGGTSQRPFGSDRDVLDGHVGFLGGVEWQVGDQHARFACFTLATLQPADSPRRDWTAVDWQASLADHLRRIAEGPSHLSINAGKHLASATFFSLPDSVDHLRVIAQRIREHDHDYLQHLRRASRLMAGDVSALEIEVPATQRHCIEFLSDAFWLRLASTTRSPRIRAHAMARLGKLDLDPGLLRTLAADAALAEHLPAAIRARARAAPSALQVFVTDSWWRGLLFAAHLGWCAFAIVRIRRSVEARRMIGLWMLVPAGLALPLWSVYFAGVEWNTIWLGQALQLVGVWAFCWRATRNPSWFVVALLWTAVTIASATDNLEHTSLGWALAAIAVLTLPNHPAYVPARRTALGSTPERTEPATSRPTPSQPLMGGK